MNCKKVASYIIIGLIFVMFILSIPNEIIKTARNAKNSPQIGSGVIMMPVNMLLDFHKNGETYALGDLKYPLIEVNGFLNKAMNKKIVNDAVKGTRTVRLEYGGTFYQSEDEPSVSYQPQRIKELSTYLKDKGINMCFCAAPSKISKNDDQYLYYKYYSSNDNTDTLMREIHNEADALDFRDYMPSDSREYSKMFFKTDHHWTIECAFECFTILADKLKNDYGFSFDDEILNKENYSTDTYESCFVGSQGRRVGSIYGGKDDFTFIEPEFNTYFIDSIPSKDISEEGSFSEVFITDREQLRHTNIISRFNTDPYSFFVGGNIDEETVINNNADNEKKLLLVHDSFGKAFLPFVAMTCRETASIDLRYYNKKKLSEYINEYKPDAVIFCYGLSMFREESMFDFGI